MTRSGPALFFTAPAEVEARPVETPDPGSSEVLIEALASGISAGTELNVYRGLAPQWRSRRDPGTGLFIPAETPEWSYPARYGYALVGRVAARGPEVEAPGEGELVFAHAPHGAHAVVPAEAAVPLGDLPDPALGVLLANLTTALNGVLDARPPLGAEVVVMGAGVIGQLVVRLLARTGPASLTVVDGVARRRELALAGGATRAMGPAEGVAEAVREATGGRGADVVVEVSGAAPALNEAIRTAGANSLVVAMSWYGGGFEALDLSGEFHHNRIRVVSSQVGALDPALGPLWTLERRGRLARRLLGELELAPLVTHRLPIAQAAEAYGLLDRGAGDVMQVVLTYGGGAR